LSTANTSQAFSWQW